MSGRGGISDSADEKQKCAHIRVMLASPLRNRCVCADRCRAVCADCGGRVGPRLLRSSVKQEVAPETLTYTIKEAAAALGIWRTPLCMAIIEGELTAVKRGSLTLVPSEALRVSTVTFMRVWEPGSQESRLVLISGPPGRAAGASYQ